MKTEISTKLVDDIVSFIDQYKRIDESIPAVALYTGKCDSFDYTFAEIMYSQSVSVNLFNCSYHFTDIPLFPGTNLSDHDSLFRFLSTEIEKKLTCRLVLLHPSQEISVKYLLGCMICSFITGKDTNSALVGLRY